MNLAQYGSEMAEAIAIAEEAKRRERVADERAARRAFGARSVQAGRGWQVSRGRWEPDA